jgi:glycosyltransferase involved in cell wall biosynthesis
MSIESGRPRRVLLLTQDLEVWGAQRQLVELAKGLDRSQYDVQVGALESGGPLEAELDDAGIPVMEFPRRWRWDLSPIAQLSGFLRQHAVDVLHSFMFLPNFYSRIAGVRARTPVVVSSLRSSTVRMEGWHRFALDVATCVLCDAMVANSEAGARNYVRHGGLRSRVVVIRNGRALPVVVDPADLQAAATSWGLTGYDSLVGMLGALEPRKDQALLLRAMVGVVAQHPGVGLVLAGEGSRRGELAALATNLGLSKHVVFPGTVQAALLYPLLDVYVQASSPTYGEGNANSLLEAMGHALPAVATDVGGNRELVVDGDTGLLVPAGDSQSLGRAIAALIADPQRRKTMGRAGRERARTTFGIGTMVRATEAVYQRLLADRINAPRRVAKPTVEGATSATGRRGR